MVAWTCWGGLELSIKNQFIIADSCLLGKRDCFSSFFSGGSKKGLPGALWGLRGAFSKGPPWWSKCHRPTGLVEPVRCTQRRGIACQRSPGTDSHPSHVDPPRTIHVQLTDAAGNRRGELFFRGYAAWVPRSERLQASRPPAGRLGTDSLPFGGATNSQPCGLVFCPTGL